MRMKIIKADAARLSEILEIEKASFTCPWSEQSFLEAFDSPNITIYAAISGECDTAVGFACVLSIGEEAEILNIASSPDFRRMGTGTALLDFAINECVLSGVREFFLEVRESNTPARRLYEKLGFEELGVRKKYYTKPTENAIIMRKSISDAEQIDTTGRILS